MNDTAIIQDCRRLLDNDRIIEGCVNVSAALVHLYHAQEGNSTRHELDLQDACASLYSEVSQFQLSISPAAATREICSSLLMAMRKYHRAQTYEDLPARRRAGAKFFFRALITMNLFDGQDENDQKGI